MSETGISLRSLIATTVATILALLIPVLRTPDVSGRCSIARIQVAQPVDTSYGTLTYSKVSPDGRLSVEPRKRERRRRSRPRYEKSIFSGTTTFRHHDCTRSAPTVRQ